MAERDYGAEIDALKAELKEIKDLLSKDSLNPFETLPMIGHVRPMRNMIPGDSRLSELMEELCVNAGTKDLSGLVTHFGVFASGGAQRNWIRNAVDVEELFALIENKSAERVLSQIGSGERLSLLLTLLRKPKSVTELVEHHGYNSTGQVYHHLKPLTDGGFVCEKADARGVYEVVSDKVQGVIMLLTGILDLIN